MIIFGAGIIGEVTLHAARAKGIPIECVVDDRIDGTLCGVDILTTEDLERVYFRDIPIYLTSPNIADMIQPLESMGFKNWKSCGELVRNFEVDGIKFRWNEYSPEHIKYLVKTCLHHHDNYLSPEKLTVQSVDLIITEKCSLKCKDCSNLMQYYEAPENADLNEMLKMIDDFTSRMDEVYEVRVIGGEPFMNKEIHLIVEHLAKQEKVQKVSIFTNATIVPRDYQWEALTHEKVRFFVTDYDRLSRNLQKLLEALESRRIPFISEPANNWTDCASLEKHNRSDSDNERLFSQCCAKNLATVADGRLYRCPFAANAFKLQAVPDYKEDYVVLSGATREGIKSFLRDKTWIRTCDHCNGRSYNDKEIVPGIQTKAVLAYTKYDNKWR